MKQNQTELITKKISNSTVIFCEKENKDKYHSGYQISEQEPNIYLCNTCDEEQINRLESQKSQINRNKITIEELDKLQMLIENEIDKQLYVDFETKGISIEVYSNNLKALERLYKKLEYVKVIG